MHVYVSKFVEEGTGKPHLHAHPQAEDRRDSIWSRDCSLAPDHEPCVVLVPMASSSLDPPGLLDPEFLAKSLTHFLPRATWQDPPIPIEP